MIREGFCLASVELICLLKDRSGFWSCFRRRLIFPRIQILWVEKCLKSTESAEEASHCHPHGGSHCMLPYWSFCQHCSKGTCWAVDPSRTGLPLSNCWTAQDAQGIWVLGITAAGSHFLCYMGRRAIVRLCVHVCEGFGDHQAHLLYSTKNLGEKNYTQIEK